MDRQQVRLSRWYSAVARLRLSNLRPRVAILLSGSFVAAVLWMGRGAMPLHIGLDSPPGIISLGAYFSFSRLLLSAFVITAIGVLGGFFVGVGLLGVDEGAFWSQMQAKVELYDDVVNGVLVKSLVFGVVVTWIAVFEGFDAVPTSEGVSAATTRTVVHSSLAVLGLDFVLTALMFNE